MLFKVLKMILAIIILLVIIMMILFVIKGRASQQGQASGLQSGTLAACPSSPNCVCLLYTSPSPRDATLSRMPSSA